MVLFLSSEVVAGENNEMNFMIIRFSATEGNCPVHSLSLFHPTLDFLRLRLYKCLPDNLNNDIETIDKYLFRFLR